MLLGEERIWSLKEEVKRCLEREMERRKEESKLGEGDEGEKANDWVGLEKEEHSVVE